MIERGPATDDTSAPRVGELLAVVLAGVLHVAFEVLFDPSVSRVFNAAAGLGFLAYVARRVALCNGILRDWGMRWENFWPALFVQLGFCAAVTPLLIGYGLLKGRFPLPETFWWALGLYPFWGIAQQFALQNLLARNLTGLVHQRAAVAVVAAVLFGSAHAPRGGLVVLAAVGGFFFTLIYQRYPNLWAVGITHGLLGALAVYAVLGEDPVSRLLEALRQ